MYPNGRLVNSLRNEVNGILAGLGSKEGLKRSFLCWAFGGGAEKAPVRVK